MPTQTNFSVVVQIPAAAAAHALLRFRCEHPEPPVARNLETNT